MAVKITESNHPLVKNKLSYLVQRDSITHSRDYERLIYEMGLILTCEITKQEWGNYKTEWIDEGKHPKHADWCGGEIVAKEPVVVAVVRAGLTIAQAARDLLQTPYMAHIGVFEDRNPNGKSTTTRPFMVTVPENIKDRKVFIFDLFNVRGRTAEHVILQLLSYGAQVEDIHYVALIMSPEARTHVEASKDCDGVHFHCARIDTVEDRWLDNVKNTYHRLFRTMDRPDFSLANDNA